MQLTQPTTTGSIGGHEELSCQYDHAGQNVILSGVMRRLSCGIAMVFAGWFCVSAVRGRQGVADGEGVMVVRGMPPPALRACRDDLPGHPFALAGLVSSHVAYLRKQKRD